MKFSYCWLKEFVNFKESPQKLAEFLALRAFEVESVLKKGNDWALEVKILPNRMADASGHEGLGREVAISKNLKIKNKKVKIQEIPKRASQVLQVRIENPNDCPRYTARVMTGLKVRPSPEWLLQRLELCGIQSINNVVDAANYVMLEFGQPLHVFDYEKLKAKGRETKAVIVRRARKGERLAALDEKTYALDPEILVIADEKGPLAIAGIKGGKDSGVSKNTTSVVLEAANFDMARVRIASQKLSLKTDASIRFSHGLDPNQTTRALDRLAGLIQELAGGEVLVGYVDEYPRPLRPRKILFRPEYADSLIGAKLGPRFYRAAFERLGWGVKKSSPAAFLVEPPTVRQDIQIEEDLIEEAVRLFGYEHISARAPLTALRPAVLNEELLWEAKVKDFLVGAGFTENFVYEFTSAKTIADFEDKSRDYLELENPTNADTQYLLRSPFQAFVLAGRNNLRQFASVRIFGMPKGFRKNPKLTPAKPSFEEKRAVIVVGSKNTKGSEPFYELKGAVEALLESLGIAEHWYDDKLTKAEHQKTKALHPYRTAKIMSGQETLGFIGELHPQAAERIKLKGKLAVAELNFEKLWKLARAEAEFEPISRFPAVVRDIAVVLPEYTKIEEVLNVIETAGGNLLRDTDLFDYFQDEAMVSAGEKSLAFHLIFQSEERTLTDEEVNRLFKKIVHALSQKDWQVRE